MRPEELAAVELPQAYQNSCEITTDAKGKHKVTVKAYAETLECAVALAVINYRMALSDLMSLGTDDA